MYGKAGYPDIHDGPGGDVRPIREELFNYPLMVNKKWEFFLDFLPVEQEDVGFCIGPVFEIPEFHGIRAG